MPRLPLAAIDLPPGIVSNGTALETKGRWRDGNLIRWYDGHLRPIGGWQRFTTTPLTGIPRALQTWRDNNATPRLAIGTPSKLYVHDGSLAYDITPSDLVAGRDNGNYGLGFGAGNYGVSTYGTPRSSSGLSLDATVWDLDNFGQELIAFSPADGRIFHWVPPATGTLATVINASAPIHNYGVIVTDERFVVALGAGGDPRSIAWCSQEDYTQWTASSTNTAGALRLKTNGLVRNARRMPGETLIFTDVDVHSMRFIGTPYVYGINRIGTNCGLIARKAHAATQNFCVWMGNLGFYIYDGVVRQLDCDIQEYVFDNLNRTQASKIVSGVNSQYNEVWWLYPSAGSNENDTIAIWNYKENWWSYSKLARTAWADREVWPYPIAATPDGTLYQHETGWTASGVARYPTIYAQSAPFDVGNGERFVDVNQLIPDNSAAGLNAVELTFGVKPTPNGVENLYGPYTGGTRNDGYIDVRFTGRQATMKVTAKADQLFQLGVLRFDPGMGGKR